MRLAAPWNADDDDDFDVDDKNILGTTHNTDAADAAGLCTEVSGG